MIEPVPALADRATEIRLGHFPNVTHAQAVMARAGGQYEKALGVPVRWSQFNAGPSVIEAIFAGALDAAYIGPNPAINGYVKSRGEALVIVAGAASGGAALVVRADAGINTDADFAGKTIATPQLGNTQDVAARLYFQKRGYKPLERGGTLDITPLANADQLVMFQKKQIDAAWTIEPWVTRLVNEAGGRVYVDEKSLWPGGRYVTTQLIVSRPFLQNNSQLVRKLLAAHVQVTQEINADKAAAATTIAAEIGKETGKPMPVALVKAALARVELTWDPIASSLRQAAHDAHALGYLREEPKLDGIYEIEPLNTVLREKGLEPVEVTPAPADKARE